MELLSRAALNLAAFITVGALFMLIATEPGTPERIITVFTLAGGLIVIAVSAIILWHFRRKKAQDDN